jgi:hypothetical protein
MVAGDVHVGFYRPCGSIIFLTAGKTAKENFMDNRKHATAKKLFFGAVFFVVSLSLFAQIGPTGSKPEAAQSDSSEVSALQTAYTLAKYGYANESASALIGAAEILAQTPTQALDSAAKKADKPPYTPEKLLTDGKKFAAGDKTMLAWASEVEASLKVKTRGAVNGPKQGAFQIAALRTEEYTASFRAGQLAEVAVAGNGYTDLDLYIYDENNNLITWDENYGDNCYVRFVPKWTGLFKVRVVNRGKTGNVFLLLSN